MKITLNIYILFLIIIILLVLFYYEFDHISYRLSCIGNSKNRNGLPTPTQCKNRIISILKKNTLYNYTLIDFGCGGGDAIQSFYPYIQKVIGIEIDKEQSISTRKKFSDISSISIVHSDITDYQFINTPTILYIYEPLFFMKVEDAIPIYQKVITSFINF